MAFVLMPYEEEFDEIYNEIIVPALEEAGFEAKRANSISHQRNILEDIVKGIHGSDLIIADLTGSNPNVFYELGMAHGLNKPVILITQSVEEVPFDLRSYRMIDYGTYFSEARKFREELTKIASQALKDALSFGNPISDFLRLEAPRVKVRLPAEAPSTAREELEEEKGLLDWLDDSLEATEEATECLERIAKAHQQITQKLEDRTLQIQEASASQGRGAAKQVRRLASETAKDISDYAEIIEHEAGELAGCWDRVEANTIPWLGVVPIETPQAVEGMQKLRSTFTQLEAATAGSLDAHRAYRDTVSKTKGISADLTRASRRTTRVLDQLIAIGERQYAFASRVLAIIDDRLEGFEASREP